MIYDESGATGYRLSNGRRILASKKEQDIRLMEEIAHARADACNKVFYVIEDFRGRIMVSSDPATTEQVLRVCRPIPRKAVSLDD